ncbi:MAG: hypothetical protein ACI4VF_04720 [Lachnospirales bacterium]
MKKKVIIAVVAIFVVAAIFSAGKSSNDTKEVSTNTASEQVENTNNAPEAQKTEEVTQAEVPAVVVSASDLIAAYTGNEVKADKDYKDKKLQVTGIVDNISVVLGQTAVRLSNGDDYSFNFVSCAFSDEAEIEKVSNLSKGSQITVEGVCEGYDSVMNVNLKGCVIK